jgi:hypothetical protein
MTYYVKSLEQDLISKRVVGLKKVDFQSVEQMVRSKTIKPNTLSFGKKKRLACTMLHDKYTKTYRAQGIIFQTKQKPDQVSPFDLVLLTNAKKIVVQYYRIQDNLHEYYNHALIPGYEQFIFDSFKKMIAKISSPDVAWKKMNVFRTKAGFTELPMSKFKLVEYNEAMFERPITIVTVALFGYGKEIRLKAQTLDIPWFRSAKAFYDSL